MTNSPIPGDVVARLRYTDERYGLTPKMFLEGLEARKKYLSTLPKGWDGYRSNPIPVETIEALTGDLASDVIDTLPQLVPGSDGSIQAEWHIRGAVDVEYSIDPDGKRALYVSRQPSDLDQQAADLIEALQRELAEKTEKAKELDAIAFQVGEEADPFAASEAITALQSQASSARRLALEALTDVEHWATTRCPADGSNEDIPCQLCGASGPNGMACRAVEQIFPPKVLATIRAAIRDIKGAGDA